MDDDDDFFAELCGVTVADMGTTSEDDSVLLKELCISVERAVLETQPSQIDDAIAKAKNLTVDSTRLLGALALGKSICEGAYADVVRSDVGQRVVAALKQQQSDENAADDAHIATVLTRRLHAYVLASTDDRVAASYESLFVGVAFLNLFVQANYTGPAIDRSQLTDVIDLAADILSVPSTADDREKAAHREALLALQVDGESPFTICEFPYFLAIARAMLHAVGNAKFANWSVSVQKFGSSDEDEDVEPSLLVDAELVDAVGQVHTGAWWNARAVVAHERLLIAKQPSNTLWYEARRGFVKTTRHPTLFAFAPKGEYLHARAMVEWGLAQHFFDKNKQGKKTFQAATDITEVSVELSGSLGKRTKFQQKAVAQMVLLAKSKYPPSSTDESTSATVLAATTPSELGGRLQQDAAADGSELTAEELAIQRLVQDGEAAYRDIQLDQVDQDNILLENIAFDDAALSAQGNLQVIDQVVLLSLCLDVKNSNANDGLTREEMYPYITRVLENPNNWMVYSTALLERAWLESESSKRRERGVLQMQALVDQHTTRLTVLQNSLQAIEDAAPAHERMAFVYALAFPPRYALKRDLAERYLGMGVMRSALELFLELEMWDDIVTCYQAIDQPTKAEKLVRERLAIAPSPYMWTSLGDITGDISHYETAWDVSKRRYARAKRSLGRHFFSAGDYETSIRHYLDSVEVNPMNNSAWFILGTMAMRTQNWPLGLRALTRVVQLDPENGEAWGNIGSIHLTNGRYAEAFSVFQEALKQKREMWQMWENFAFCAIQVERYGEAMYALHQWLDLREKHKRTVDHELLAWLVEAIVYGEKFAQVEAASKSDEQVVSVLQGLDLLKDEDDEDEDLSVLDEVAVATDKAPPVSHANYKKQLALLFGRITSITATNAKIWQVYAHFNDGVGRKEKALDCRLKQCRSLQIAGWETNKDSVDALCKAAVRLAQDYVADGTKKALYACRLYIRGVLRKAQVDFGALESVKALAETLAQVETLEQQL